MRRLNAGENFHPSGVGSPVTKPLLASKRTAVLAREEDFFGSNHVYTKSQHATCCDSGKQPIADRRVIHYIRHQVQTG